MDSISARVMTEADVKATARAIKRVFPRNLLPRIGQPYVEAKCRYHMSSAHSCLIIACKIDDVVGFLLVTSPTLQSKLPRRLLLSAFMALLSHPWTMAQPTLVPLLLRRGLRILFRTRSGDSSTTGSTLEPSFSISQIGVDSPHRGMGIAGLLFTEFESQATQMGVSLLEARASESNKSVWRAYEKQGWVQMPSPETPGIRYYVWQPPA